MQDGDYLHILSTLQELPFNVGKGTLVDVLSGAVTKKMVSNDTYMDLQGYGSLEAYSKAQIGRWVDKLVRNGYIRVGSPPDKPYWKLLYLTRKGVRELQDPAFTPKDFSKAYAPDSADEESKALIEEFGFFLDDYNAEQRHAIVCPEQRVLCVAGAGSGKTTVLTKRAEFLAKYRGVEPGDILAVTFTRKAREQMEERLSGVGVDVVTFNALCERMLRAFGLQKPIVSYREKIGVFRAALEEEGLDVQEVLRDYFTPHQMKQSAQEELVQRFMRDVYSILDHYANEAEPVAQSGQGRLTNTLLSLARTIQDILDERGLRDYSGQLKDALAHLKEHPDKAPSYEHVLVDEYQDINKAQRELLDIISADNEFVVGDPRQSIYGWRGSKVEYIRSYDADATVQLRTNYRSDKEIISVANKLIEPMGLPDLTAASEKDGAVQTLSFDSEAQERKSVAGLVTQLQADDVFVLARTNAQLEELSALLKQQDVPHTIKHEDDKEEPSGLTLATVHAIKGLEADAVVAMGAGERYYPCKVADHPVVDLIKSPDYDREEEERRLLYVAVSRARHTLIITHSGTRSHFLDPVFNEKQQEKLSTGRDDDAYEQLKQWRSAKAKEKGLPAYCVCTDKTLRQLTEQKPQSLDELKDVHGLGDAKIGQYGEELLTQLR